MNPMLLKILTLISAFASQIAEARNYDEWEPSGVSWTVIIIGLLHAIPILIIGSSTKKIIYLYITAAIMTAVAFLFGNVKYFIADMVFVALATVIGKIMVEDNITTAPMNLDETIERIKKENIEINNFKIKINQIAYSYTENNIDKWISKGLIQKTNQKKIQIQSLANAVCKALMESEDNNDKNIENLRLAGLSKEHAEALQDSFLLTLEKQGTMPKGTLNEANRIRDLSYYNEYKKYAKDFYEERSLTAPPNKTLEEFTQLFMQKINERNEEEKNKKAELINKFLSP